MDWSDIQSFLEILRRGRIDPAARSLGVTAATLRHRLSGWELRLGEPLFDRVAGALAPTATARTLQPLAETMEAALGVGKRSGGAPVAGTVRVTATEAIGVEILTPLLVDLQRRHPGLMVTMSVSLRYEDLLRGEADIAVRLNPPTQKAMVMRPAMIGRMGLFASRDFLARAGAPTSLDDLKRFDLIGSSEATATPRVLRAMGFNPTPRNFAIRIENQSGQLNAVRAGAGIGVGLVRLAARHPELMRILPEIDVPRPAWICTHEDLRQASAIRVVLDAIVAHLAVESGDAPDRTTP